jgi:hypothetical protein
MGANDWGGLRFVQPRFYNPHHHPEMPRTLQSLDRRVRHGEELSRCTMITLCFVLLKSDPESSVTHLKEKIY